MTNEVGNLTLVYQTIINNKFFDKLDWKDVPEGKDPLSFIRYVNENVLNFISHPKKSELIITILSNFD